MEKILILLGINPELDEELLKKAPVQTIKQYLKNLNLRLLRLELIVLGGVGVSFLLR